MILQLARELGCESIALVRNDAEADSAVASARATSS